MSTAAAFEQQLGDPASPDSAVSFARAIEADEREELPSSALAALDELGLHRCYVPVEHGGALRDFTEISGMIRAVARRDLTAAIAHGKTFLGVVPVWVGGDAALKERVARLVLSGHPVALALTERELGSDLLSMRTTARADEDGYHLDGEKWLINNATRCAAMTVFARTQPQGGSRGFSLLFVEKSALTDGSFTCLPRVRTHGIRGADISGICFDGARVQQAARIGAEGAGLEVLLKALQVSRSLLPALSLGAADTALRLVLEFTRSRSLYGGRVLDIPHARRALAECFLDLLICDALIVTTARALHAAPEQMSKLSAVVKYFVPTTVDRLLSQLSVILGARFYLREEPDTGIFQKILRDHAVAALFDGSTVVNLTALALQMPRLASLRAEKTEAMSLRPWLDLSAPLPLPDLSRLTLVLRGSGDILQALPDALRALEGIGVPTESVELLKGCTQDLLHELSAERSVPPPAGNPMRLTADWFDLAERHTALHAAATCLLFWLHNREQGDPFFREGTWTALAMTRLLSGARLSSAQADLLLARLCELAERSCLLGLTPTLLAPAKR